MIIKNNLNKIAFWMMISNVFLILPVVYATIYHEWLYLFFASGIFVFSPLYHWYKMTRSHSIQFRVYKAADWMFALGAFMYMYYYIYVHLMGQSQLTLFALLSLTVVFFWYGWQRADYEKYHPWFHIIAPIVSSVILVVVN